MTRIIKPFLLAILTLCAVLPMKAQNERSEIDDKYKWDLTPVYESDDVWEQKLEDFKSEMQKVTEFKGKLGNSSSDLLAYLTFSDKLMKEGYRLYIYASLKSDMDLRDMDNLARTKKIREVFINFGQLASFVSPELAAISNETIQKFLKEEPKLEIHRMDLEDISRMKMHTLSDLEEALMAKTGMITGTAGSAYNVFSNAEMPWENMTLSNGEEIELNRTEFSVVRASADKSR